MTSKPTIEWTISDKERRFEDLSRVGDSEYLERRKVSVYKSFRR